MYYTFSIYQSLGKMLVFYRVYTYQIFILYTLHIYNFVFYLKTESSVKKAIF